MESKPSAKRRADAERSITAIVEAALECLRADPNVGMAAIARAAQVSRVTLYAHFPTREAVVEAATRHAMTRARATLDTTALDALPADEALAALTRTSWRILDHHLGLFAAVSATLPPETVRDHHERAMEPLRRLLHRGREEGTIRTDQPVEWLVSAYYHLIHAAAAEVRAGRLPAEAAPDALVGTLLPALRPAP